MLREEIEQVKDIARAIAKEEIAKALAAWSPPAAAEQPAIEQEAKPTRKAKVETP